MSRQQNNKAIDFDLLANEPFLCACGAILLIDLDMCRDCIKGFMEYEYREYQETKLSYDERERLADLEYADWRYEKDFISGNWWSYQAYNAWLAGEDAEKL